MKFEHIIFLYQCKTHILGSIQYRFCYVTPKSPHWNRMRINFSTGKSWIVLLRKNDLWISIIISFQFLFGRKKPQIDFSCKIIQYKIVIHWCCLLSLIFFSFLIFVSFFLVNCFFFHFIFHRWYHHLTSSIYKNFGKFCSFFNQNVEDFTIFRSIRKKLSRHYQKGIYCFSVFSDDLHCFLCRELSLHLL